MAKSGRQYADDVRELRAAGVEFASASRGYLLADAANWSSGQKAAVTRAANALDVDEFDDFGFDDAEDSDFLFEQAAPLEQFDFDDLADLDEPWDDFIDDIVEDFDGIEETDYEDAA